MRRTTRRRQTTAGQGTLTPLVLLTVAGLLCAGISVPRLSAEGPPRPDQLSKLDYFYRALHPVGTPRRSGQDALGAIQETVGLLLADPTTDWSEVSVARLRRHLADLDRIVEEAEVEERAVDGGVRVFVRAPDGDTTGRALASARRAVPEHAALVRGFRGWRVEIAEGDDTLELTLTSDDPAEVEIVRALGFFGFLATGVNRPQYHLALAQGRVATAEEPVRSAGRNDP